MKSFGIRLPRCATTSFAKKTLEQIPVPLRAALVPLLDTIQSLTSRIAGCDRDMKKLAEDRYPVSEVLRQVNGVGPVTSLAYVLTLQDCRRFKDSRCVGACIGLRPRSGQSGERNPEPRITRAGDRDLRSLLVQSAQYILGPFGKDSDPRRFGLAMAGRGSKVAKRKAVIAVARKLAVLLHSLWRTSEVYEPLRNSNRRTQSPTVAVAI